MSETDITGAERAGEDIAQLLDMQAFFPYRLAVLAEAVSRMTAEVYADRFALTRQEWRVVAALANLGRATATEVADYSTLDKMQVSRAIAALEERGVVARSEGQADRRTKVLVLTRGGEDLYRAIAPLVLERQRLLLAELTEAERDGLNAALTKLLNRARSVSDAD